VAEAVEIQSPTHYSMLGTLRNLLNELLAMPKSLMEAWGARPGEVESGERPLLLNLLERDLYGRMYCRPSGSHVAASDMLALRDYVGVLSAANTGTGTWEAGWTVAAPEEDQQVAVAKDGITFWVAPHDVRTSGRRLVPGARCRVRIGKELRHLIPGFYTAIGNGSANDLRDTLGLQVRLYWHLTAASAPRYLQMITERLNAIGLPFRTKVVVDPNLYMRADAGVLYIERSAFARARGSIQAVHHELRAELRPEVPMFTKRLADGLGLAEDPGDGLSFGQSRCSLAARALWSCYSDGLADVNARLERVALVFRQCGLDPARPYLNPRSSDIYTLVGTQARPPRGAVRPAGRQ
jgi:hypothetical protein